MSPSWIDDQIPMAGPPEKCSGQLVGDLEPPPESGALRRVIYCQRPAGHTGVHACGAHITWSPSLAKSGDYEQKENDRG